MDVPLRPGHRPRGPRQSVEERKHHPGQIPLAGGVRQVSRGEGGARLAELGLTHGSKGARFRTSLNKKRIKTVVQQMCLSGEYTQLAHHRSLRCGGGVRRGADAEHAGAQQLGTGHATGGHAVSVAGRQDEEVRGGGGSLSRGYTTRPGAGSRRPLSFPPPLPSHAWQQSASKTCASSVENSHS